MISKRTTKTTSLSFVFLPLVLFLASCASEVGNSNDEKKTSSNLVNPSQVLKTLGDLPACNSESEGFLYYIESISQFRYCSSTGSYASIDLTGPQGPAGADGKDGVDGAQGVAGPQGPAGADGQDGVDGAQGVAGPQGPAGADGKDGVDGISSGAGIKEVFATTADLPVCNSNFEGHLYYVEDIAAFRYCNSLGSYTAIDLTGPQGPAGADGQDGVDGAQGVAGPQGPAGPAGADGTDNRATYTIACAEPFTAFGISYSYLYSLVGLSSGDIIVTGEVSGSGVGVSTTLYYSKFQNSAITTSGLFGQIVLTADIFQTSSGGFFVFKINPDSLAIEMEYYDSQLPSYGYANPQTLSLNTSGSGCVRNTY